MSRFFDKINGKLSILVTGPRKAGKSELCIDYMKYYLENGGKVIFMITDSSPDKVRERFSSRKVELKKYADKFIIIDCYSAWASVGGPEGGDAIPSMPDIKSLKLSVEKASARLGKPVHIFIDSASTVFLYNDKDATLKFLKFIDQKVKGDGGSFVFTLHHGVHEESSVREILSIIDGAIEMEIDDDQRSLSFLPVKGKKAEAERAAYSISDSGIVFKDEKRR